MYVCMYIYIYIDLLLRRLIMSLLRGAHSRVDQRGQCECDLEPRWDLLASMSHAILKLHCCWMFDNCCVFLDGADAFGGV